MEQLIKFKSRMDKLNKSELMNIINSFDKEYITAILFKYFHSELMNARSLSQINNIIVPNIQIFTNKINQTIISRKNKSNQIDDINNISDDDDDDDEEIELIQLHDLPSVIISSISSFLKFPDILNFEMCNKTIFIGTRSPISIKGISSSYSNKLIKHLKQTMNENKSFYWNRFKSITEFEININEHIKYYQDIKLKNIPINWNNLRSLQICGYRGEYEDFSRDLLSFNLDNLQTIKSTRYPLKSLLSNLSNPSLLQFVDMNIYNDENDIDLPPNLRGFRGYSFPNIPSNIESLHLRDFSSMTDTKSKLNNLKEVCIGSVNQKGLDYLNTQNLDNLRRVHCRIDRPGEIEDCAKSIESLFAISNVNYISIKARHAMYDMMDIINNALQKSSRKLIKVRLNTWGNGSFFIKEEFTQKIWKMVDIMKCKAKDFMIIGSIRIGKNKVDLKSEGDDLLIRSEIERDTKYICHRYDTWQFVISNKDSKINGYHEQWIMCCPHCEQNTYPCT